MVHHSRLLDEEECGIDSAGQLVWCSDVSGGGTECFPGRSIQSDREAYGCTSTMDTTCERGTSINGAADDVCGC
jgi:hypothetical protein